MGFTLPNNNCFFSNYHLKTITPFPKNHDLLPLKIATRLFYSVLGFLYKIAYLFLKVINGIASLLSSTSPLSDLNTLGHPPGYSILMAGVFSLLGESNPAIQFVQIICDALAAVMIFLIVAELFPLGAAVIAGMLAALSPQFAWNSVLLLPDSLAVLPILIAIYCLARAVRRPRLVTFIITGVLVGLSCWLRANAMLLTFFFAAAVPLLIKGERKWRYALTVVCGTLLIVLPLTIRNAIVFHRFIPLSLGAGQTLLEGIADYDPQGRFGIPNTDVGIMKQEAEQFQRPDYYGMLFNPDGVERERARLNPGFTFDSFVTGKANQLARAAAIQVSENPGISYNPLFVYGGVGLGKTHLVQAIGNFVASQRPDAKIRYIHAEQYVTDVVRAYQQKSFDEFKRYYHSLDLLLIDDIQFFSNKGRTQEEFFYAFNALVEAHKQIVITCDTYPKEISGMEERLISRFGWGLTVAIEPPELEMRVAIVLKKAEAESVVLSEDIAFFIAKHIRSNVRELEGALKKVLAFSRFNARELSLDLAKDALRDILNVANRQITVENIQKTVAEFFKLKISDMHSKRRTRNVARPRQVAMALAKDLTQMSLPEIGEAFGNRDHTTVLHACRMIASLRKQDSVMNRDYLVLEQVLKG